MVQAYLEHTAIFVKDIRWHMHFFEKTMQLTERKRKEENGELQIVWLHGGIQLVAVAEEKAQGALAHLGIMVDDLDAVLEEVYKFDVTEMPQGHNWMTLPDGLSLEIMQASLGVVQEIRAIDPRR